MKHKKRILFFSVSLLIIAGLALWAFYIEPDRVIVHREILSIPHWHSEHDGLRIAVLTDLHVGAPYITLKKLKKVVSLTNELQPDMVVILGDLVIQGLLGGRFVEPEVISGILKDLESPIGTIAVLGNHDWWYDGSRVTQALEKKGITVLENSVVKKSFAKKSFWLAGIKDLWTRDADIASTLDKINDSNPVIVLTHNPDIFPDIPLSVSLTLAGHTHGGQVNLPLIGRPIVPSKFGQRFAAGLVIEEGRHLFVGTGVGTSIFPVRFRVIPEILLLEIRGIDT